MQTESANNSQSLTFNDPQRRRSRAERIIHHYMESYGVVFDYRSSGFYITSPDGSRTSIGVDKLIARLYVDTDGRDSIGKDRIAAVLTCVMGDAEMEAIRGMRRSIITWEQSFGDRGEIELQKWIKAVCREGHELSAEIMRHWMWLVKRKIVGLRCSSPLCPILQGLSQSGKTTAVRLLTEPLKDYTRLATLQQVADDREWRSLLGRFYVVFLDDVEQAKRSSLGTLKMVISAEQLDPRILGLNFTSHIEVKSSFIGASNKRVSEIIQDPTSAARYWEIRCRDRLDWDALNAIDYYALWSCLPVQKDSRFDTEPGLRAHIQNLQHDNLRYKDPIELWEDELGLSPILPPVVEGMNLIPFKEYFLPTRILFDHFRAYCQSGNFRSDNISQFGTWMRSHGYSNVRRRYGSQKTAYQVRGFTFWCDPEIWEAHFEDH